MDYIVQAGAGDMFKIKGTGIISQIQFVRENFGDEGYARWLASLSQPAKLCVENPVSATSWYEGDHVTLELRNQICEVFFNGDPRGAREIGAFTAEKSLKGVYRFFLRLGSSEWIVGRAARLFGTFFKPGSIIHVESAKGLLLMRLVDFPVRSEVFEEMVCGFAVKALALSGCSNIKVERTCSFARGDPYTDFKGTWTV